MGNVCCGSKEEAPNPSIIEESDEVTEVGTVSSVTNKDVSAQSKTLETPEQLQVVKEEQARLEWIVQATGRRMVAVRSTRSAQGYYVDQGFAAALYQHLEQTTTFHSHLPREYPPSNSTTSSDLYKKLATPTWDSILLGSNEGEGLAGCGGKHPHEYLDHVAETFLDQVVPKNLFAGTAPIVENLI